MGVEKGSRSLAGNAAGLCAARSTAGRRQAKRARARQASSARPARQSVPKAAAGSKDGASNASTASVRGGRR